MSSLITAFKSPEPCLGGGETLKFGYNNGMMVNLLEVHFKREGRLPLYMEK